MKYRYSYTYRVYDGSPEAIEVSKRREKLRSFYVQACIWSVIIAVICLIADFKSSWYTTFPVIISSALGFYYLFKYYDTETDWKVARAINKAKKSKRNTVDDSQYQCVFIQKTDNFASCRCEKCFAQMGNLRQCRIKNTIGVRSLYLCDSCINQYELNQNANEIEYEEVAFEQSLVIPGEKENKIIKTIVVTTVAILIAFSIITSCIISFQTNEYNGQLRNMATEEMSTSFTNVYADITSIEYVYDAWHGRGSSYTSYAVCKCTTIEGKFVWVYMEHSKWSSFNANGKDLVEYPKDNPMRLIGRIETSQDVADLFVKEVGDVFVLCVESFSQVK